MQARCPHCTQVFTAERPGVQFCPHCGQQLDVPGWVEARASTGGAVPPPGEAGEGEGDRRPTAWERRGELGLVQGFFQQWKATMLRPQAFWPTVRPAAPWLDALLYGWGAAAVSALLSLPLAWLGPGRAAWLEGLRPLLRDNPAAEAQLEEYLAQGGGGPGGLVGATVVQLLFYPVAALVTAALLHLSCVLVGCARNGFQATWRALLYGSAPLLLGFLGSLLCVGPLLGALSGVYALVQVVLGVQSLQETSGGRAAGAVLIPVALFGCCVCVAVASGALLAGMAGAR